MQILLLSLEFAPVQTTGAFRPVSFAKYLADFGIEPVVLTLDPDTAGNIWHAIKNDNMAKGLSPEMPLFMLKPEIVIRKVGAVARMLQRYLRFDDGFSKMLSKPLADLIQDEKRLQNVSAVLTTIPPFGAALLGAQAANLLGVPLILDARDAWTQSDSGMPAPSYLHYLANRRLEARVFAQCNAFVTVTERLRGMYIRDHPEFPANRQYVIANGFDGEDISSDELVVSPARDMFNVGHVGSLYGLNPPRSFFQKIIRPHLWLAYPIPGQDWSYRGVRYFFSTWKRLFQESPEIAEKIRFHCIGPVQDSLMKVAADFELEKYCICHGVIPKDDVQHILKDMQVMLSTSLKKPDGGDFCLASKTFDYIQSRKPILAFVCEGSQRDFLENSGAALICDPDNVQGSAEKLGSLVRNGHKFKLNADYINQFHRRESARRMADAIYEVTGKQVANTKSSLPYI